MRLNPVLAILGFVCIIYAMPLLESDSQVTRRAISEITLKVEFTYETVPLQQTKTQNHGDNGKQDKRGIVYNGTGAMFARRIVEELANEFFKGSWVEFEWGIFIESQSYVSKNEIQFTLTSRTSLIRRKKIFYGRGSLVGCASLLGKGTKSKERGIVQGKITRTKYRRPWPWPFGKDLPPPKIDAKSSASQPGLLKGIGGVGPPKKLNLRLD
ncbi:hypothetical protein BDP27DRAFT_1311500 [Rhodocollybia butyracea]|uniref:Ribosomal protein S3 n=1 Tax=Rhodocollybia butyracea TaxID=206335 RepID=A0A9P5Q9Z4_9AGAR|nr:hypothetical protein BDP27DRAFT_1311500 [Rhodocollybia butyracea]